MGVEGQGQRSGAGAGRDADIPQPRAGQGVDEGFGVEEGGIDGTVLVIHATLFRDA